ncbi:MAG: pseudaminic acid cytidylyltransferase [Sphingobacterium sp.]
MLSTVLTSFMQNSLCIIPARGGSKRIPRKNIKNFLGKPIIAYSIEAAIDSGLFSEIMVSTDDEEIAEVARQFGASVPFIRSLSTSDDNAVLADVVDEVAKAYNKLGSKFDHICCLLPTAPFVTVSMLDEALLLMKNSGFDSVRPVVKFSYPIQRALRLMNNCVEMANEEFLYTRSQDLEPMYHDAGMFYWMKSDTLLKGEKKGGIIISEISAQDIDTLEDWEMAEIKYKILKNG